MSDRKLYFLAGIFLIGMPVLQFLEDEDYVSYNTAMNIASALVGLAALIMAPLGIRYILSGDIWREAVGYIAGLPATLMAMSNRGLMLVTAVAGLVVFLFWNLIERVVTAYAAIGVVVMAAGLVAFALWYFPRWQTRGLPADTDPLEVCRLENEFRRTVGQMLTTTLLVGTLYFTWRQLMVAEDGKVTDRFSSSINMLSSANTSSRIGAIYALERVAKDSAKDYRSIVEILTAYIREAATMKREGSTPGAAAAPTQPKANLFFGAAMPDVQAALTVLGRRPNDWLSERQRIFLENCDLRKVVLVDGKLMASVWTRSDLSEAMMIRTDLRGAYLDEVNLTKAEMDGARLEEAHLWKANLTEANVTGVNFDGADLRDADLTGLRGYQSILSATGANIFGAKLSPEAKQVLERLGAVEMDDTKAWMKHLEKKIIFRSLYSDRED